MIRQAQITGGSATHVRRAFCLWLGVALVLVVVMASPLVGGAPRPLDQPFAGAASTSTPPDRRGSVDATRLQAATNVFVGRVMARSLARGVGHADATPDPHLDRCEPATVYAVDVVEDLKGQATGVVIVAQPSQAGGAPTGGYDQAPPEVLAIGELALFAVVFDPDNGAYFLTAEARDVKRLANGEAQEAIVGQVRAEARVVPDADANAGSDRDTDIAPHRHLYRWGHQYRRLRSDDPRTRSDGGRAGSVRRLIGRGASRQGHECIRGAGCGRH